MKRRPGATGSVGIIVLCPHFAPDSAPTGTVMTRIVAELVALGHRVHVVTSLPWYRSHAIEPGWTGRWIRREQTEWGSITRVHPFPGDDKSNLLRRAVGFVGYSALAGIQGLRTAGWFRRADVVIAMSPPLTLGLTGRIVATLRRAPLIFNIQDVFPDAAIETGAITNRRVISVAEWLERISYRAADAVTVLSVDLADNVRSKLPDPLRARVHEIPNFVDTDVIRPLDRNTASRSELDLGNGPVVLYGGNVGFSQSLELMVGAARLLPDVMFLINGDGAARASLEASAADLPNVVFRGYVDESRLGELLATGDIHVVPLKAGLARVSVPSKTYSIMAAGRPVLAAIDAGTAVPQILADSGGGIAVAPDDVDAFVAALTTLLADPEAAVAMGEAGRRWVVDHASPAAVGRSYDALIAELGSDRRRRRPRWRRTPKSAPDR
ncbi:glycosyltransferase family 4 protein [Ilumatobacter nonamiensis]|uniref:glycosyltransferase family 4 protein n=1 Tax=Ilumatobacter nonamiensis TaxID=467093 RepID=UPI00034A37E3|nr:glycosyltransferase family 4 protein [Ilumatobacter nonamiensis]